MYSSSILASALALFFAFSTVNAWPTENDPTAVLKRQSTTWVDTCSPPQPAPSDYKAFNLANCQAQINFSRGKNVAITWTFDALYADGVRIEHKPFRNFSNIAVSDPFYTIGYGNNYLTNRTQSSAFTSVHEFTNVCRNGQAPTAWILKATPSDAICQPKGYQYTTERITAQSGTRPAKTNFTGRQLDSAGNIEVSWTSVAGAQSYNVFVQIPTGQYEDFSGYFVSDRGARVSGSTTRAVFPGVLNGRRFSEEPRKVYVNVQNGQGVWSFTPETYPIPVRIS